VLVEETGDEVEDLLLPFGGLLLSRPFVHRVSFSSRRAARIAER
jgi:hypothetical protein